MNKLKYWIVTAVGAMVLMFTQMTYAGMCQGNPDPKYNITPVHISGVINLHISKYGVNYPLQRGDYSFESAFGQMGCLKAFSGIKITGSKSLIKAVDIQGNDAWKLPMTPQEGVQPQFAIEPGIRLGTQITPLYADGIDTSIQGIRSVSSAYNISLVTISDLFAPTSKSSMTYTVPDPVAYVSVGAENYSIDYPAIYLDSFTVTYTETSCGIKSKQGSVINWPALYKTDIVNGTAESKPYSLSLICGNESDPALPVNISFTSTHGFADAANGIVKTNLANLGLKLSWVNPALTPLALDQVNKSMLAGVGDYSVLAKPVKLSKSTDTLQSGQFDTTVTMNIEFQ
ncbi:fimbrial protein [Buttiauxella selenatireducens]|uniref:Fimbrial protein n=1 Tax=Buttiauxella selenatireducens TaxID=3073902 RepID=A0ABY9SDJ7_9ENTR|nr:fimbrial protein [Buttiauxella sp. R73]WMY75569.1 fimbrial protein [Buttiauxella sp. R73]